MMKKNLRHILIGVVVILLGTLSALVIADTVNQEKQLLVDGDMEDADGSPVSAWTLGNNPALTKETNPAEDGAQSIRIAYIDTITPYAYQTILTVGKTYRVTGWGRGDGTYKPIFRNASATPSVLVWTGTNSTSWQYFDEVFTAGAVAAMLYNNIAGAGWVEFDDILVTEYTPPIVNNESEVLVDGDMEEDGTDIAFIKKFDLTQAANITADSGVITGALTYTCAGADFDGTNDYVTYTVPSTLFSTSPSVSIVIEFTPDFAFDADVGYYFFDTTNNLTYYLQKKNNAGNNELELYLGNTLIAQIASASYSSDWNANARNVLVVSGTTGDTNVWLNGTQILTADATAWTVDNPTNLHIGANFSGSGKFDGEIHAVSIYSGLLDGTDVTNLYNSVDTSDWTAANNACLTKQLGVAESGSQILRVAYSDTDVPYAYQVILTSGKTYRFTGWARGDGTHSPRVASGSAGILWDGTTSTSWQYFDVNGTSNHTWFYLQSQNNGVGYAEFDDILVTEYTPPMVNDNLQLVLDGDMEKAGTTNWGIGGHATVTKESGFADDGSQVLRILDLGTGGNTYARQGGLDITKTYRWTGWARGDGTGVPKISVNFATAIWTGTNSTDWQHFDFTGSPSATYTYLLVQSDGQYVEFDDVFITQTEPQYNNYGQILVDGDMEEDGTDIFFANKFDLTQAANIAADSGSITGSLSYTCAGGDMDGTSDYVTYTIADTLFSTKSSLSIVVEFTPDFDYDEDATRVLYDTTAGNRYFLQKMPNANSNALFLNLGSAFVQIPSASYSAYWLQNARNVLVISGTTGDIDAWLNGTQILTDNATAWSPASPIVLKIGTSIVNANKFDGEIHAISIYSGLLDGTDAQNLYDSVDTSDWTAINNACLTKQLGAASGGSQVIRVAYVDASTPIASQDILITDQEYRVTGWARGDGTVAPRIVHTTAAIWTGTSSASWQYFDETFTAGGVGFSLKTTATSAGYAEYDSVVVTRTD